MYNVVMFIRYYSFLSLIYLVQANCEKQLFDIPIKDDDCVGRKSRYKVKVDACRGYCQSASVNTHYTVIDSTSASVKPVTSCKCCHALSYTTRIFQVRCKKNKPLQTKTFVVHSAKECGCKSCGPDLFEYNPVHHHTRSLGKRKRSRSSGLFLENEPPEELSYDNNYSNGSDTDTEDRPSLVEVPTEEEEEEEEEEGGQITNYRDSDVLR